MPSDLDLISPGGTDVVATSTDDQCGAATSTDGSRPSTPRAAAGKLPPAGLAGWRGDGSPSGGSEAASEAATGPDEEGGPAAAAPGQGPATGHVAAAPGASLRDSGGGAGDAVSQVDEDSDRDQRRKAAAAPDKAHVLTGKILDAPSGVRVWCDGMTPDSRQPWWDEMLALASLMTFMCWIHVLLGLAIWSLFNKWALLALAVIWGTTLLPAEPLLWERFLGNPVFRSWRRYFRYSVAYDTPIDLTKHYVYAEVPHSVFPLSQLIATSLGAEAWQGHKVYSIAADSVLSIPLWRHIFTWVGARPANAREFRKLLKKGSVGLVPGGIAEMFMSEAPHADVVKLKDRKGFVRLAVEAGAPLVPIYHFGSWDLCRWLAPRSWAALSRKWRMSLGFLVGRYGLPLPHRVPLFMCVGAPIPVPKLSPSDPGFAAAVDKAHAELMEATQKLFDKYKSSYPGYENRVLKIV